MNTIALRSFVFTAVVSLTGTLTGCASDATEPYFSDRFALVEAGGPHDFTLRGVSEPGRLEVRTDAGVTAAVVPYSGPRFLSSFAVRASSDAAGLHTLELYDSTDLVDTVDVEFAPLEQLTWEPTETAAGDAAPSDYVVVAGQPVVLDLIGRAADGRVLDHLVSRVPRTVDDAVTLYQVERSSFLLVDTAGTFEVSFEADGLPTETFPLVAVQPDAVASLALATFDRGTATCVIARGSTGTGQVAIGLVPSYVVQGSDAAVTEYGAARCFDVRPASGTTVTASWNGLSATSVF